MTSALDEPPAVTGAQRPQVLSLPSSATFGDSGDDAIEICTIANVVFDPWQEFALRSMLWEDEDRTWSAFECGMLLPRQNGKGEVLMGRELFGLFVANESLMIHSAHEFKTAEEAFKRIRDVIKDSDYLSRKVRAMPESHGDEAVELHPIPTIITGSSAKTIRRSRAPRLRFFARTGKAGRGFTADTVVWDEAFNLPDAVVSAQQPMLSAVANPQLILASSAVDQTKHDHGKVLARLRKRALAGGDPDLCWVEWQADEAEYTRLQAAKDRRGLRQFIADPAQWVQANPGIGYRLSTEHTAKEHRSMSLRSFVVERLNIGDWPEVKDDESAIDMDRWDEIADPESRPDGRIALGIDISPDRQWASIASAGRRLDGKAHVKIVDHRPFTTAWVVERIMDLVGAYKVCAVVLDPAGPAGALIEPLKEAKLKPKVTKPIPAGHLVTTTAREMAQACGALVDDIDPKADNLRHCGQDNLDDAIRDAVTRPLSDAWAWDRKASGADITPLVAVTLAHHGYRAHGNAPTIELWASR